MEKETKQKPKKNRLPIKKDGRCSSYDNECKEVDDPLLCFLGKGRYTDIGITDGHCPLIHGGN